MNTIFTILTDGKFGEENYKTVLKQWFYLDNLEVKTMEDRRKVLFTNGMSNDFMLIITDAPKEKIET